MLDSVFREVWPRLWDGLSMMIDGMEQFDPVSVWRHNVMGLTERQFLHGITMVKETTREYPCNPGQFREWCKAAGEDPAEQMLRLKKQPMDERQRQRASEHIQTMRRLLR